MNLGTTRSLLERRPNPTPEEIREVREIRLDPIDDGVVLVAPHPSRYAKLIKPAIDKFFAVIVFLIVLPIMAVTALAIMISLGRPVILRQQRVGQGGDLFTVFKFRTMHHSRRVRHEPFAGVERRLTHKHPDDPRLTPTGRVLRKLSLDELPQLINVLRGEMSLVGPRPELPDVVTAHYEDWHHRRHAVKPGITGLWQVSERGNGMMHEHIDLDLDYIAQVCFMTDLRILAATPAALISKKGY